MSQALGKGSKWLGAGSRGMSNMTAIFVVALIGVGLYFWIFRPKRGN